MNFVKFLTIEVPSPAGDINAYLWATEPFFQDDVWICPDQIPLAEYHDGISNMLGERFKKSTMRAFAHKLKIDMGECPFAFVLNPKVSQGDMSCIRDWIIDQVNQLIDDRIFLTVGVDGLNIEVMKWAKEPNFVRGKWSGENGSLCPAMSEELSKRFTSEVISSAGHILKFNIPTGSPAPDIGFTVDEILAHREYLINRYITIDPDGVVTLFRHAPIYNSTGKWVAASPNSPDWMVITKTYKQSGPLVGEICFANAWRCAESKEVGKFVSSKVKGAASKLLQISQNHSNPPPTAPRYVAIDEDGALCSFYEDPVFVDGKWCGYGRLKIWDGYKVGVDISRLSPVSIETMERLHGQTNIKPSTMFSFVVERAHKILKEYENIIKGPGLPEVRWGSFTIEVGKNSKVCKSAKAQFRRFVTEYNLCNYGDGAWIVGDRFKLFCAESHPLPLPGKENCGCTEWDVNGLQELRYAHPGKPVKFWVPGWFIYLKDTDYGRVASLVAELS